MSTPFCFTLFLATPHTKHLPLRIYIFRTLNFGGSPLPYTHTAGAVKLPVLEMCRVIEKKLELVGPRPHPYPLRSLREMARKRKNRTHVKTVLGTPDNTPKSFVIKHGQVGPSLAQLVHDMRKVMEPNTASRLRVSRLSRFLRSPRPFSYTYLWFRFSVLTDD